jgi:hypothetical protein
MGARLRNVLISVAALGCLAMLTTLSRAGAGEQDQKHDQKVAQERVAWVEKCLNDFEAIKPGMTRKEVAERLAMESGLQALGGPIRFVHRECPLFKMDVSFDFKRDSTDQGRAISSPDDKVTETSKPYFGRPILD